MTSAVNARIFSEELASLYQLIAESDDVETGGELLGLWSHQGSPTIMVVTGPDDDATRTKTHFLQPPDIHMSIERYMWDRFGLQVLGIWHSHHRLGLIELSDGDRHRTQHYADTHGRARYVEFLGYIDPSGRPRIRPYLYSDAGQLDEVAVEVLELPGRSPIRDALRRDPPPTALHASLLFAGARAASSTPPTATPGNGAGGLLVIPEEDEDGSPLLDPNVALEWPERDDVDEPELSWAVPAPAPTLVDPEPLPAPAPPSPAAAAAPVPRREDVTADMVLALEAALGRLPESATSLVKLRIDSSGLIMTITPPGRHASLFFPVEDPTEMECRTASGYTVMYAARPDQSLADFYYENLAALLDMAVPATSRRLPTWLPPGTP